MLGASRAKCRSPLSGIAVLTAVGAGMFAGCLDVQAQNGSPGPLAASCGVPKSLASDLPESSTVAVWPASHTVRPPSVITAVE